MVNGTVEAKSFNAKYGSYGMLIEGKWYNSKYEIKAEKGDEVEFDDGGKNYIKGLKVVSSGGGSTGSSTNSSSPAARSGGSGYGNRGKFPIGKDDGQRSIIRQNSLARSIEALEAANMFEGMDPKDMVSAIISTARLFEAYSAGDLDREAAEQVGAERNINDGFDPND